MKHFLKESADVLKEFKGVANTASIARVASAFVNPAAVATASTNSAFFIVLPPYNLLSTLCLHI